MKVLVINCGSSSLKYQLFDMTNERLLVKGCVERIGSEMAIISQQRDNQEVARLVQEVLHHSEAVQIMLALLLHKEYGVLQNIREIKAVGHRIVHGGEWFHSAIIINNEVQKKIKELYDLAPLHNPAHIAGIQAVSQHMPNVPQVSVFDTAFHQTLPKKSYLYAIPLTLYNKHGVRRYGFHGTSHEYVSLRAAELLEQPTQTLKMVTCHLGNGASCAAIANGRSIDTSMGMTPLEGLIMGTRSGDLDAAIIPYVMAKEDLTIHEINSMLNKHSGLMAISGISGDMREIQQAADAGNPQAILALDMYEYRIRKYIGAYSAAMNGIDALVFTGGVGENSSYIRRKICEQLTFLGLELDGKHNEIRSTEMRIISTRTSKISVMVIPTNEELMIAQKTFLLLKEKQS
jgi:acetate kinase